MGLDFRGSLLRGLSVNSSHFAALRLILGPGPSMATARNANLVRMPLVRAAVTQHGAARGAARTSRAMTIKGGADRDDGMTAGMTKDGEARGPRPRSNCRVRCPSRGNRASPHADSWAGTRAPLSTAIPTSSAAVAAPSSGTSGIPSAAGNPCANCTRRTRSPHFSHRRSARLGCAESRGRTSGPESGAGRRNTGSVKACCLQEYVEPRERRTPGRGDVVLQGDPCAWQTHGDARRANLGFVFAQYRETRSMNTAALIASCHDHSESGKL